MEMQSNYHQPTVQRCPASGTSSRHTQRARASPPLDPEEGHCHHYSDMPPPPQLTAAAMQPPRLQGQGCCNKLVIMGACCLCLMLFLFGCTAVLSAPMVMDAKAAIREHMTPEPLPAKRPLPAILHRYGMIKRAQPPGKGADPLAMAMAFPHWRGEDGSIVIEAVVNDVALGLAAIAEQLDPSQELRIVTAGATPFLEPPPQMPPSDEDGEAEEL